MLINKMIYSIMAVNVIGISLGQTYQEMGSLLGHLFNETRYNKMLRPLQKQSNIIKVNVTQFISSIVNFDISSGELLITGVFEIKWIDEMLTWDPALIGGKTKIMLPEGKYWKPDFHLMNGPANEESSIYGSGFTPAWVSYQGLVRIIPAGSYKTKCDIDTTLYPYDVHKCYFKVMVSNHDTTELMLYSPTTEIFLMDIKENGEWEIKDRNTKILDVKIENIDDVKNPMFQSSFSLNRRPTFELINAFTPLTLMSCLNIATCFVRPDSGERLSFAITLYLSLVVTSTAVTDKIPKSSLKMPYFSYQVLMINCINTIGVLWSIYIVYFASKQKVQHIPRILLTMVKKQRGKNINKKRAGEKPGLSVDSFEHEDLGDTSNTEEKEECLDISGLEVAEILDGIYFWVVVLCITILNTIFIILLFNNRCV